MNSGKLSIAVVHNKYRERGGEDASFESEADLLEHYGHPVTRIVFDNHDIPQRLSPIDSGRLALSTVWSRRAVYRIRSVLRLARPDVVHFENTFPLVSPAAYAVSKAEGAAVIQSLRNFRLVCPNALLFRDGHVCEDCLGRKLAIPAVVHRCYRRSRAQTAVVATMLGAHHLMNTWSRDVDIYIALTEFSRAKFVEGGLPIEKIRVKPNFLDPDPGRRRTRGTHFLFVGRLADYKGVEIMLSAWEIGVQTPLHIVGSGPLASRVREGAARISKIRFLGHLDRPGVFGQLNGAKALVFPSQWYEGFPNVILEAFACGIPVIAGRIGSAAEIVRDGETGLLFKPSDAEDLVSKLIWAQDHPADLGRMGLKARREYESKYTAARNYTQLLGIYEAGIANATGQGAALRNR